MILQARSRIEELSFSKEPCSLAWVFRSDGNIALFKECVRKPPQVPGLAVSGWWSEEIPEDGWIHANLAQYLSLGGRGAERAALLSGLHLAEYGTYVWQDFRTGTDFGVMV